jgi:hypothetical protein
MANYFYDLPIELQKKIYFEEHKKKNYDNLCMIELSGVTKLEWDLREWLIQDELEGDDKKYWVKNYYNKGKVKSIVKEKWDTRIDLRRFVVLDSRTFIQELRKLCKELTVPELKNICRDNNIKNYSKLNKRQLLKLTVYADDVA